MRLEIETVIAAPRERCFDLSRDLDLHLRSMHASGERAVGGRTSGLIGLDEEVTWEARHFGVLHRHSSRITAFQRPAHFRDSMIKGRFRRFEHDHYFTDTGKTTLMRDVIEFASPLGWLGRLVDQPAVVARLDELFDLDRAIAAKAAPGGTAPEAVRAALDVALRAVSGS